MTPALSLNYNSNVGNGLFGRGWSLAGLSVITRCPQTIAQDGRPGGVNLDDNDRFCLDGKRLIAINGGVYGANLTEYRTEIESFTRVISYAASGTSPDYFMVWTRSGKVIRYGFSADSSLSSADGVALLWCADRVEDRSGNYLTISYDMNEATGEHYPLQVFWTGNDRTGLSPYSNVRFVYEDRNDHSSGYLGGSPVGNRKRVKNIQVVDANRMIRDYRLSYDYGPVSGASRLIGVTACESEAPDAACQPQTRFDWNDGVGGFAGGTISAPGDTGYTNARVLDVDGDGRQDLVVPHDGSWWVHLGGNKELSRGVDTGISTAGSYLDYVLEIDFNSDGEGDLLVPGSDGNWDLLLAGNGGLTLVPDLIPDNGYHSRPRVLDIDGDGRQDLVVTFNSGSGSTRHVYLNTADGFSSLIDTGVVKYDNNDLILDYNNDGRQDLLTTYYQGYVNGVETCDWRLFYFDGHAYRDEPIVDVTLDSRGVAAGCRALNSSGNNVKVADVNADGLQDMVYHWGTSEFWRYLFNTGGGLNGPLLDTGIDVSFHAQATDYNSDARVDYIAPDKTDNHWHVYQSGDGTVVDVDTGLPDTGYADARIMDVNGDGLQDVVSPYDGVWNVFLQAGNHPDQISTITDGAGQTRLVDYRPLNDSDYTKGAFADSSDIVQDYEGPLYVVSRTRSTDGVGEYRATSYSYAGARMHMQGRGFQGFQEISSTDEQSGIVTKTTYRQDFPFTGLPEQVETTLDGLLLGRTQNTYRDLANINGDAGVHFPWFSQSSETSYDLPDNGSQGAVLKTVNTVTSYDDYGNPCRQKIHVHQHYQG